MIAKQNMLVILQARMSSSRLPGKVLANINGKPMIFWQISRIKRSKYVSKIVVATSNDQTDDELALYLQEIGVDVIRGDLENVYERFRKVLYHHNSSHFARLTADCPLVMPELIDVILPLANVVQLGTPAATVRTCPVDPIIYIVPGPIFKSFHL